MRVKKTIFTARLLAAICLFGLAASPSWAAKKAPPSSAKWEKDIAAFEAEDRTNNPPAHAILFVGSSTFRMWTNLTEMIPGKTIIRRGFGGSHVYDMNAFFDRIVLRYHPSKIVLYAGDNDIADGRSPAEVFGDFKTLANKVSENLPKTKLYFLSAKLCPSRWHLSPQVNELNAKVRNYARLRTNVEFVDVAELLLDPQGRPNPEFFAKDRLHLNNLGYQRWARRIYQVLQDE